MAAVSLDWLEIGKVALSSAFASALLTEGLKVWHDHNKEKASTAKAATYSALRLAVLFEEFSINCADAIYDTKRYLTSDGHTGTRHSKLPTLHPFPDDVDWRALDVSLSAKALAIRNEFLMEQQGIDFWYDEDADEIPAACLERLGLCGYHAWEMAFELRAHYKIPPFNVEHVGWDFEAFLKGHHATAIKMRAAMKGA
ncbi:hypothetical protein [Geomonas ferrireducens]|uniref:hypothetical protein n=1 Tax=Geomonas ferrireducens TaxID=2570227 RepID=UPI0010A8FE01|nr:hypothetical protein [Geomonas ferrireducens]